MKKLSIHKSRGDKFFNMNVYFARVVQKITITTLLFLTCTDMKSSDYLYLKRQNYQMIHILWRIISCRNSAIRCFNEHRLGVECDLKSN